ncbi:hypothetical protein [Flavobacterium subsaxonicum]|uniref:Oligosaccharide repeat unit polymerase n=1 Tax=Flavobacterium subsaxonicum WB 4.1-42 = DSM 21790 TaxID=1121898 RepID=A0A0A2ML30_9FLAO|nr:hypothetical protein [Flavobacterium subsaxonicum]KGO93357.1 hypothetical protein Q766_08615 [Flavobacterium subsaxonicum WB 4.1-42 = DSM 21790]
MIFLCFFWFALLYFLTYKFAGSNDVFAPLKFISVKYAVFNLPFLLFTAFNPNSFLKPILNVCGVSLSEAFWQYTIVQTVAFLCLVAGVVFADKKLGGFFKPLASANYNYKNVRLLAVVFFAIGMGAYTVFLSRIGGLGYLLNNINKRIELQSGQYVLALLPFLTFSTLMFMLCIKLKNKMFDKVITVVLAIVTIFVFSSFGARKNTLVFLVTLIVAMHYLLKNIKINKKTLAISSVLGVGLLLYIIIIPTLRFKDTEAKFTARNFVYQTSYTYIDVFAANYFNSTTAWNFKGFFEPFLIPFKKQEKSKLPQIDQGVYFNAIVVNGKHYEPPMSRDEVSKTSWPAENFGTAYANLLMPGIVIFFFLQGVVFLITYNLLRRYSYNPVLIMLYLIVVFDFNFSSLRIASFIRIFPIVLLAFFAVILMANGKVKDG